MYDLIFRELAGLQDMVDPPSSKHFAEWIIRTFPESQPLLRRADDLRAKKLSFTMTPRFDAPCSFGGYPSRTDIKFAWGFYTQRSEVTIVFGEVQKTEEGFKYLFSQQIYGKDVMDIKWNRNEEVSDAANISDSEKQLITKMY